MYIITHSARLFIAVVLAPEEVSSSPVKRPPCVPLENINYSFTTLYAKIDIIFLVVCSFDRPPLALQIHSVVVVVVVSCLLREIHSSITRRRLNVKRFVKRQEILRFPFFD